MLMMLVKTLAQTNSFAKNYNSIYCVIPNLREVVVQELQNNYKKKKQKQKHSMRSQCECKPKVI